MPSAGSVAQATFHTADGLRFANEAKYESELRSAKTLSQEDGVLRQFGADYGLKMSLETGSPSSYAQENATWNYIGGGDVVDLRAYAAVFIDEWAKYPRAWIRVSGVTTIVLVTDLVVSGAARAAMPDPIGKALYLDILPGGSIITAFDSDYARGVIHHEFDHDIEYDEFGTYSRADPLWTSYDPKGFRYGSGGASWYDGSSHANLPHPKTGFVTSYAMTGIEEDKAETYSYLFVDARYKLLKSWVKADPELAGKVAEYKAFIREEVPMMDDAYFAAINP